MNTLEDVAKAIKVMRDMQRNCSDNSPNFKDISMAISGLCKQLTEAKNISSSSPVMLSLPLSELPKLFQWIREREIDFDDGSWIEFIGHDTPNEYTTEELIEEYKRGNGA